ncbi:MAG: hypothetical protein LBE92_10915 [Chryseobacterium sp.]|jgi:hypothetical protein|uniref:hypothetical protein n=1 Tax=Chryseobacterium sp. TaxID=1871047 RepID=UPI0028240902|nr:hypothetical protein [Chryseobacterium sp.]MDR2236625.1 hypothetical protein [Chryseobacterium sp.]
MKIKYIIIVIFTLSYFPISCKEHSQTPKANLSESVKNIDIRKESKQQDSLIINFLDKKYQSNGLFIPDYSPSFPSYTYSDKKVGIFSVNYIGKTSQAQQYWDINNKNGYFSKYQNPEQASNLSDDIKKFVNLTDYYILASYTPNKYISYIDNTYDEFELKPNAVTYFYLYIDKTWKLIHEISTDKIPIDDLLKFQTNILQKEILKNNNNLINKYDGVYNVIIETSIPSAEIARSKYTFTIKGQNVDLSLITYLNPPLCEGKYFAVEKNNMLELYYFGDQLSCISIDPKFYIKKEGKKFYIKGIEGEATYNQWIIMK